MIPQTIKGSQDSVSLLVVPGKILSFHFLCWKVLQEVRKTDDWSISGCFYVANLSNQYINHPSRFLCHQEPHQHLRKEEEEEEEEEKHLMDTHLKETQISKLTPRLLMLGRLTLHLKESASGVRAGRDWARPPGRRRRPTPWSFLEVVGNPCSVQVWVPPCLPDGEVSLAGRWGK